MKNCNKCKAEIGYGVEYYAIVHHIESTQKNENGDLYTQVISAEEMLLLCKSCGEKLNSKITQKLIKGIVAQDGASN